MSPGDGDSSVDFPLARKARMNRVLRWCHLVTFCHRLRECPFFRVFEGERRFDGFPDVPHRNAPNRAFFGPYRMAHRDAREARTRKGILRVEIHGHEKIHKISTTCEFKKSSNFKDLRKISTKSTKSTGCLGFRGLPAYAGIYIRKRYFFFFIFYY